MEFKERLQKYQVDCEDFASKCETNKQVDEAFRYRLLSVTNQLNSLVQSLMVEVDGLVEGVNIGAISAKVLDESLRELSEATRIITESYAHIQSSMARTNTYKRNGEFDEYGLLYMMVNTQNDVLRSLVSKIGELTISYTHSVIQEKMLMSNDDTTIGQI